MVPYSRPKRSDIYALSSSKLLENHTLHSGTYDVQLASVVERQRISATPFGSSDQSGPDLCHNKDISARHIP